MNNKLGQLKQKIALSVVLACHEVCGKPDIAKVLNGITEKYTPVATAPIVKEEISDMYTWDQNSKEWVMVNKEIPRMFSEKEKFYREKLDELYDLRETLIHLGIMPSHNTYINNICGRDSIRRDNPITYRNKPTGAA